MDSWTFSLFVASHKCAFVVSSGILLQKRWFGVQISALTLANVESFFFFFLLHYNPYP